MSRKEKISKVFSQFNCCCVIHGSRHGILAPLRWINHSTALSRHKIESLIRGHEMREAHNGKQRFVIAITRTEHPFCWTLNKSSRISSPNSPLSEMVAGGERANVANNLMDFVLFALMVRVRYYCNHCRGGFTVILATHPPLVFSNYQQHEIIAGS